MTSNIQDYLNKGNSFATSAVKQDKEGNYEEAYNNYRKAVEYFSLIIDSKDGIYIRNKLIGYVNLYIERGYQLYDMLYKNDSIDQNQKEGGIGILQNKQQKSQILNNNDNSSTNDEENKLKQQILQTKLNNSPNVKWSDIIGLDKVKKILHDTITLPLIMPQVFVGNRKVVKSILLYGPPGTGKTNLAKAVATNSGQSFYSITSADIISKYVGESERNIKVLFDIIKNDKPCILFIDEIDSLCSKREESSNTKTVQQFLIQLDGIGEINMDGILLLGATNLPWILDMGMRRRFEKKIYIPLPDEKTRELMLKYYISKNDYSITQEEFCLLSRKTINYSGSDIDTLCKEASRLPTDMILNATHFEKAFDNIHIRPCSPNHPNAIELNYIDVYDKKRIIPPSITAMHINIALKDVKSSVDIRDLQKYEEWTKEFGQY